ncbi:DUF2358 domain-containing protein [Leptolyngbya sp. AN02str]|uniref:DUF2358 domain-containing protein n=1 Tax=Leptolyngbya sp. AN02str TaxID=3423363 RepID=UPI003D31ED5B
MDLLDILKVDYRNFPHQQTFSIYAEDVYFKDPMTQFRGRDRYQQMLGFIETWFRNIRLDLHNMQRTDNFIRTDWTLSWNTPLPWQPRISISGWSELTVNDQELISSHVDYWHCSRFDVLKQHFSKGDRPPSPPPQ